MLTDIGVDPPTLGDDFPVYLEREGQPGGVFGHVKKSAVGDTEGIRVVIRYPLPIGLQGRRGHPWVRAAKRPFFRAFFRDIAMQQLNPRALAQDRSPGQNLGYRSHSPCGRAGRPGQHRSAESRVGYA